MRSKLPGTNWNGIATREFMRTLELCSSYSEEEVARAMGYAVAWHATSFDVVEDVLKRNGHQGGRTCLTEPGANATLPAG